MTPVISPWVFYLMEVVDGLLAVSFVTALGCGMWLFAAWLNDDPKRKVPIIGLIVSVLMIVFAPSGDTITKMLVAQNVTYERVEAAADTVQNVYEDIMELFEEGDEE